MKLAVSALLTAAACVLVSCGGGGPVADDADESGGLPAPRNVDSSNPTGAAPPANAAKGATPAPATSHGQVPVIPSALHGRWGLGPEDCIQERGDNKGVLQIGGQELRFYESTARPSGNARAASDSYSADFAFTGEGQQWSKFQTLRLEDGKLVRTESTPMASYTYARCS